MFCYGFLKLMETRILGWSVHTGVQKDFKVSVRLASELVKNSRTRVALTIGRWSSQKVNCLGIY